MKLRPLPNTVVHLKTQAEYDEYMQMCEDAGWLVFTANYWTAYKDQTCVLVDEHLLYSGYGYYNNFNYTILTLPELKAKLSGKEPKADTWTLDAPIYRRGSDWIREDKMCIDGIEYTFDKVCEQEAKFRAFRRAHSRYFPKAR